MRARQMADIFNPKGIASLSPALTHSSYAGEQIKK